MSNATNSRDIFWISIFVISITAFSLACSNDEKDQPDNNQPPPVVEQGVVGEGEAVGEVPQDPNAAAQPEAEEESQTEDPGAVQAPQAGEPATATAGIGGSDNAAGQVPVSEAGTVLADAGVAPSSDAAVGVEAETTAALPCSFDVSRDVTIIVEDPAATPLPDAGSAGAGFMTGFMPPVNGVCLPQGDPCEGGSLEALELPDEFSQTDTGVTTEIDRTGGCAAGTFCCIGADQCAASDVSLQQYLDGPSAYTEGSTVRESLLSFIQLGASVLGVNVDTSAFTANWTCAVDNAECTGTFSVNIGCPGGNKCCMSTSADELMSSVSEMFP